MTLQSSCLSRVAVLVLALSTFVPFLHAQGPLPDAPVPSVEPIAPAVTTSAPAFEAPHKFWDRENELLFAGNALLAGADFTVTRANLQSGGQELNPIVRVFGRSTAGLAVNFAGETAAVIGVSYFLHKTGHHKLERAISCVNMGSSAGAVTYGLLHR